jgi:hypothetical protein
MPAPRFVHGAHCVHCRCTPCRKFGFVDVQPRRLKGRTLDVTYSRLHDGNGTHCDPVAGPFVASKWAGLGRVSKLLDW